jgi:CheY-like chemotaxis protein
MMPGIDGLSLCEILKTREDTADIPIIILTAKATMGDVEKAFAVRADDFVAKPFEWPELFGKINRCLALSRAN